jgi:PREDICTED: similar to biotin--protein ligase (biotin apo-protein ligase)
LKWPNDIYIVTSDELKIKIGGVLVKSHVNDKKVAITFGCGINVNNALPTVSLNGYIQLTSNLEPISIEEFIASTLSRIESFLSLIEEEGPEYIKQLYIKHWIHSKQIVKTGDGAQVMVKDLDDHGYLVVENIQNGNIITLHPDGNRFDMLQNLLIMK